MSGLLHIAGFLARLAFDRRFRREWSIECALEDEGEDGETVARLVAEG